MQEKSIENMEYNMRKYIFEMKTPINKFAKKADVSRQTIYRFINRENCSVETMKKIYNAIYH